MSTIAYDTELRRPGCPIVQRSMGATIPSADLHRFDSDSWLLSPTPTMGVYPVNAGQLEQLVAMTNKKGKKR